MEAHLCYSERNLVMKPRERERLNMGPYIFLVHMLECAFRIMPRLLVDPVQV